jgi:hypothetical protein
MEKDANQFESEMDSKIRRYLVEEGYLFPLSDSEIETALKELSESNVTIPPHLDDPLLYLYQPGSKPATKVVPFPVQQEETYLEEFTALAAREGADEIPPEVLEQMKKDREDERNQ